MSTGSSLYPRQEEAIKEGRCPEKGIVFCIEHCFYVKKMGRFAWATAWAGVVNDGYRVYIGLELPQSGSEV